MGPGSALRAVRDDFPNCHPGQARRARASRDPGGFCTGGFETRPYALAWTMGQKAAAVRLAPPTRAPSTLATAMSVAALAAFTEPP